MMNELWENLLNAPQEITEGQVWRSIKAEEDFVVTDSSFIKNKGIVRAAVISNMVEIDDSNDIKLYKEKYPFFASNQIVLRVTDGPMLKNDLELYRGKLSEDDLVKIKKSIKLMESFQYNPPQKKLIAVLLDKLQAIRFRSFTALEQDAHEQISVFPLSYHFETHPEEKTYQYSLAAGSNENQKKIQEFWEKERKVKENSLILIEEPELLVRLTPINNVLYLVAFTEKYEKISHINLKIGKQEVSTTAKELYFGVENRIFTHFLLKEFIFGEGRISFILDDKTYNFNINFK